MFYLEALKQKKQNCKNEIIYLNTKKGLSSTLSAMSYWLEMCLYVVLMVVISSIVIGVALILGEKFFDENS